MKHTVLVYLVVITTSLFCQEEKIISFYNNTYRVCQIVDSTGEMAINPKSNFQVHFFKKSKRKMSIRNIGNSMYGICTGNENYKSMECYKETKIAVNSKDNTMKFIAERKKYTPLLSALEDRVSTIIYSCLQNGCNYTVDNDKLILTDLYTRNKLILCLVTSLPVKK